MRRALSAILFISIAVSAGWAQFYAVESYTWDDKATVPVLLYIPGGGGIHQVTLGLTISGATASLAFFLQYPDGTADVLKAPALFDTEAQAQNPASTGKRVEFTHPNDDFYQLTIAHHPDDGTFSQTEAWGVTIAGLGSTSSVQADIGSAPAPSGPITDSAEIIPDGCYWTIADASTPLVFYFTVPKRADGPVQKVTAHLKTSTVPASFDLKALTSGSDLFSAVGVNQSFSPTSLPIDMDVGDEYVGTRVQFDEIAAGEYRLTLTAYPDPCFAGLCGFKTLDHWQLYLNGMPVGSQVLLSLEGQKTDGDTIILGLNRPPVAAIDGPVNQPATAPARIMRNRKFQYHSAAFDAEASGPAYEWRLNEALFASEPNADDPTFWESFPAIPATDQAVKLRVTENVAAPPSPLLAFNQTGEDRLSLQVIPIERVRFPARTWYPVSVDGEVVEEDAYGSHLVDLGWGGSARITHQNGTDREVAFQGLREPGADFLYLSFEVRHDPDFHPDDTVILGFRPNTMTDPPEPGRDLLILLKPFAAGHSAGNDQAVNQTRIWKDSRGWGELTAGVVSALGIQSRVKSFGSSNDYGWNLEIKLPISRSTANGSSDWEDFGQDFLFFYRVIRVSSSGLQAAAEFAWPRKSPLVDGMLENLPFSPLCWSEASRDPASPTFGVRINNWEVGVLPTKIHADGTREEQPLAGSILLPRDPWVSVENLFQAIVRNNTKTETSGGDQYLPVSNLQVRFRLANWGLGPAYLPWQDVPADIPPPPPPRNPVNVDVPAGSATIDGTSNAEITWKIDTGDPEVTDYQPPHDHQCVLVELEAAPGADPEEQPGAQILNRSVFRNLDFVNASRFDRPAEVSGKGYGLPPSGSEHRFFIHVRKRASTRDLDPKSAYRVELPALAAVERAAAKKPVESQTEQSVLQWEAAGYLSTGRVLVIGQRRYAILDPIGSFGYLIEHEGTTEQWKDDIGEAQRVAANQYILRVPAEGSAWIQTRIRPLEVAQLPVVSLHAGSAFPLSALASSNSTGTWLNLDLGWRLTQHLSGVLVAGYAWFPGSTGGDAHWYNGSFELLGHLRIANRWWAFFGGGPGVYLNNGASWLGAAAVAGLDYRIWRHLNVQLAGGYHYIGPNAVQFWTLQAGILYRF